MIRFLVLLLVSLFVACYAQNTMEQEISALLNQMTLEEKIGQLNLCTGDFGEQGPFLRDEYKAWIAEGKIGAFLNAFTADFTYNLQKMAVEKSRLKIPLLFGFDVIHGFRTIFPLPLGEAASWDLKAIEKSARISAIEATAAGLHWTFAPMVDIARDPRWGRIAEGAGEDTYLGCLIAKARVRGFQGNDLAAHDTMLACAKHFAAYGAAQAGRDYNIADISDRTLWETYLPPFKASVDAGVETFMTAFNEINGVPCTSSSYLFTELLRNQWGFQGFVVSDYTAINELIPHGVAANGKDAARLALKAGVDMDMQGHLFIKELSILLNEGKIDIKDIDEAVKRILRLKYRLGLFQNPYAYSNVQREKEKTMTKEHLEVALDVAKKSIVLLKNENVLPLSKEIKTLAVLGPLADSQKDLLGCWCGAGDYNHVVSLLKGIQSKVSADTKILHAKGCNILDADEAEQKKALEMAAQADAIIVALGEEAGMSGEAASRSSISIPGKQEEFLKELVKTNKPVVLVLMSGRPLAIPWPAQNVPAILQCFFLGTQGGNAMAEVLFGDYNPSGKLPVTFPRSLGQVPIYYNYKNTGRPVSPDKYTSKYLDVENSPLYPFGFGLSYTKYQYSPLRLEKSYLKKGESLKITVAVKNVGHREGEETVQLYLRDNVASITRPVKELKGFEKILLQSGESREVSFFLTPEDMSFYDKNMKLTIEAGTFTVMVGGDSENLMKAEFEVVD
ncbi:MAG: beta-glucosidase BglX [Candidatus Brocadiae bacterium]|nr:beta-glucosidase BglX [Candidatus Brocadiia bacterium]